MVFLFIRSCDGHRPSTGFFDILLGECKWGANPVGRGVIRELIEDKTPLLMAELPNEETKWTIHYAFFGRAGFTQPAQELATAHNAILVDLAKLDGELL